jgi:hypothetical protein
MTKIPGRVAFRVDGNLWVAYWAMPDTMDGAVFLASIPAAAAQGDMKHRFMNMAKDIAAHALKDIIGADVAWTDALAPEHEKAGRA